MAPFRTGRDLRGGVEDSRDLGPRLAVIHGLRDPDDLDQPVHSSGATGSAYVLRTLRTSESRSAINAQCVDAVLPGHRPKKKPLRSFDLRGFLVGSLAVTYSGMPERHTTIGAERFHFRVRNGIGWYPLAMAARQTF